MRLSATDLTCLRGGRTVFAGIGFSVRAGEILAVTGRNGAGKSSLLRMIAGLLPAATGGFVLEGGLPDCRIAEQAHYLGHQDALKSTLTVKENLVFWIDYLGHAALAWEPALARTGLANLADLPAGYLSAGQRRRLSVARLIAVHRPVWLLDEPQAALDSAGQRDLATIMRDHVAAGGLIIATTHSLGGFDHSQELRLGEPT